jgi:hypothetical protein
MCPDTAVSVYWPVPPPQAAKPRVTDHAVVGHLAMAFCSTVMACRMSMESICG